MSLADLYRGNADLCLQMAAGAKNTEIKHEWTNCEKKWRQKAEAEGAALAMRAQPPSLRSPSPTLVPNVTPRIQLKGRMEPVDQKGDEPKVNGGTLDDVWAKIANVSIE